ncbi:MAG: non-homologous end-joining DNA ligase [Acidimicrobiia bacterium]
MSDAAYNRKRRFDQTPEPAAQTRSGDVNPLDAPLGERFVIQQHHATRLHHDVRLEMFNGDTPVLVSWAVPKGLPTRKGERNLAIRTEDHPIDYATFSGSIPEGNYGAGDVRIFDSGTYEVVKRDGEKITFRLGGERVRGVFHLVRTRERAGKQEWLALLSRDLRPQREPPPPPRPMLATLTDRAFDDPEWSFEPKWDGIRAIAICNQSTVLMSRNDNDITAGYPELVRLHEQLVAFEGMLDGEIVAFEEGKPSFQKLQSRMHVRDKAQLERAVQTAPVTFMVFDLLYLDGRDLTELPLTERRRLLEESVVPSERVQVSPSVIGEGVVLFEAAATQELEGIVAKRLSSRYELGSRSRSWLKVKTVLDADVVVVGWVEGGGARGGTIGSLVMAVYDGKKLRYVGNVGTGFTQRSLKDLQAKLEGLDQTAAPFETTVLKERPELRKAHWVAPVLVAKVEYRQLTSAGRLRVPAFQGLRDDKAPKDCTFDQLSTRTPRLGKQ